MITIVDYGVGNIASIVNIFDHLGFEANPSSDPGVIAAADKILLPGVGAFDRAMSNLHQQSLVGPLVHAAERGAPFLGVCLGMQLLGKRSEEGSLPGLGFIDAEAVRMKPPPNSGLKVPNIGWREVSPRASQVLFQEPAAKERFYFVHSYHMRCSDPADVAATINYGGPITVAVSRENIHGVQFHPEKSHRFGMRLLTSFAQL